MTTMIGTAALRGASSLASAAVRSNPRIICNPYRSASSPHRHPSYGKRYSSLYYRNKSSSLHKRAAQALNKGDQNNSSKNNHKSTSSNSHKPSPSSHKPPPSTTATSTTQAKTADATPESKPTTPPEEETTSTVTVETNDRPHIPDIAATAAAQTTPSTFRPPTNFHEFAPRISVVGVGGAGGNALNNMIASNLTGVDFLAINTDAQHLSKTLTDRRLQIGVGLTGGLGCGANPDAGRMAAEESREAILEHLSDAHMVFITAGMGGGTGTGAAPVVAELCYDAGILTVAVVTHPFRFEGTHRRRLAKEGVERLEKVVDTMIVIPNQNLFGLVDEKTSLIESFSLADDVLLAGVKSVTDLMTTPGLINLDFADVQSVMHGMGNAMLGSGQATGEDRATVAADQALRNPLLGDMNIASAKGMLVNITGGSDMTLFEVDKAAQKITEAIEDDDANIIFGSAYDSSLEGHIRVSVVATGIDEIKH